MGKPSSSSLSNKSVSNKSISNMNIPTKVSKVRMLDSKNKRKLNKNIKKLFDKLRNDSINSGCSPNNTVISLNDSNANTESINMGQNKRKRSPETGKGRKKMKSAGVVIINDEDSVIVDSSFSETSNKLSSIVCPQTPIKKSTIQCSTPIIKKDKKTLSNLIQNTFTKNNNSGTIVNLNDEIINLTKQINHDSYLTIDLTEGNETDLKLEKIPDTKHIESENIVIDLEDTTDLQDCSIISVTKPETSQTSWSGESDVTVLRNLQLTNRNRSERFVNSISQLDTTEKGKFFEYVTEKIFNGCQIPKRLKKSLANIKTLLKSDKSEKKTIKEILSGRSPSRNSVGSNVYHPERGNTTKSGLRMIVIDGSNVAMEHGKGRVFSVKGLKICIDYFLNRGHRVKAFVPRFRCKLGKSSNPKLLDWLQKQGTVIYTPSREIKGKTITPYDDRYIIQCAAEFDGVIVSGDNYRDLMNENPKWRYVIENRLLPFTWVDDMIMFPKDPLGRNGPSLERFLRHSDK